MKLRRKVCLLSLAIVCFSGVVGWTLYQAQAAPVRPLDQLMPEGALLYMEAKDFSGLLKDWGASPEKAQWLKSDDYRVFSNSRLFLRLGKASDEFALAAGVPPSMQFLNDAAGRESALAIYNIGNLEFLYVTHLASGNFLQSALWQSRNKFQPRNSAGKPFFTRKDEQSGRVVAFAVIDDYLVLGTREDLVGAALELLAGGKARPLRQEGWYTRATSAAPGTRGDLRMVLNMEKIAVTPHFRTYWVQQNITEMQSYAAAVNDLFREGAVYREERVILPKKAVEDENALLRTQQAVSNLLSFAPKDVGFYRAVPAVTKEALASVEQKILAPHFGATAGEKLAPQVQLTAGQTGNGSDLETRIDVEPVSRTVSENATSALEKQFAATNPQAMLVAHATRRNKDGVLLNIASVVAIGSAVEWDLAAVQKGVQEAVAPALTAARLGAQWREVKTAGGYYELDGLAPVMIARRGKVLLFANDAGLLSSVLQANNAALSAPVSYAAAFSHTRERQDFYELTSLADHGTAAAQQEPQFFSQNISSFSRAFARVGSEEIVMRQSKDKIQQTVTYHWQQ
jgi:hypothetical protein